MRAGAASVGKAGETRNMSSSGVLFNADTPVTIGDPVEYLITLPVVNPGSPGVRLRCMGKVIRYEDSGAAAATLERYEFLRA